MFCKAVQLSTAVQSLKLTFFLRLGVISFSSSYFQLCLVFKAEVGGRLLMGKEAGMHDSYNVT